MTPEFSDFNDLSGQSSDEFGWEIRKINKEETATLIDDVRMALSGASNASSSESDEDSDTGTPGVQSRMVVDGVPGQNKTPSDVSESDSEKSGVSENDTEKSGAIMSDSQKVLTKTHSSAERNINEHVVPSPPEVSGDTLLTFERSLVTECSNKMSNSCIISSSSGGLLQPEEVVGVDPKHFAADRSEPALFYEDLAADEEVWLVQCPNSVNPRALQSQKLQLPGTSRISDGQSQMLDVSSYERCPEAVTFIVPSRADHTRRLVVVKPAGQIIIREHMEVPAPTISSAQRKNITFPVGLRIRHPLLGADYEKELESYDKSVMRRLSDSRKQKKKSRRRFRDVSENDDSQEREKEVSKHKKRKSFARETCEETLVFSRMPVKSVDDRSFNEQLSPKRKRKKSSSDERVQLTTSLEQSETASTEYFSGSKKKKHKRNLQVEELPEQFPSKRKKKKTSSVENVRLIDNPEKSEIVPTEYVAESKKKKKHKRSKVEDPPEAIENIRKRKRGEEEASFETSVDISGTEHEGDYKKKKKRRKLECSTKSVKVELGDGSFPSEIRKGSVVAVDKHHTSEAEPCENSATESLADLVHGEKQKKKKEKKRDSAELEACTHHSVIGVSVDLGGKNKKEKERSYRFTFPADFRTKNKSSHTRKLSLNLNL